MRRTGKNGVNATSLINKELCRIALKETKDITLDIDASEIVSNLFVMLRNHLPDEFLQSRAKAVRLRIYSMAAKLIKHSRQYKLKLQKFNNNLLSQIISKIKRYQFYPILE